MEPIINSTLGSACRLTITLILCFQPPSRKGHCALNSTRFVRGWRASCHLRSRFTVAHVRIYSC